MTSLNTPGRTIVLDTRLIEYLPVTLREPETLRNFLNGWATETDYKRRSDNATTLFTALLEKACKTLGNIKKEWYESTSKEESHIRKIASNINRFEDLIGHIRTKFRGKVYRDHLHHMLRTALIASYLANRLNLDDSMKLDLTIAALVHDIGYPVQEAGGIVSDVSDAAAKVCSLFDFGDAMPAIRMKGYIKGLLYLCQAVNIEYDAVIDSLEGKKPEHAAISALEFLKYHREGEYKERHLKIASAILLHASSFQNEFAYSNHPIAVILAIADELQEWGRPIALPDQPRDIQLDALEIWKNRVGDDDRNIFEFDYDSNNHPLISAIYSKWLNLRRINVNTLTTKLELRFPLNVTALDFGTFAELSATIKIVNNARSNPWIIKQNETTPDEESLKLSHAQVAERTGVSEKYVEKVREALVQNRHIRVNRVSQWKLWRQEDSFDFIVSKAKPTALDLVSYNGRFKTRMMYDGLERSGAHFDQLIYLDRIKPETVERKFRPLSILLSLHYGIHARVYWFDTKDSESAERISTANMERVFG